jgi:hypothetical protein
LSIHKWPICLRQIDVMRIATIPAALLEKFSIETRNI